MLVCIFAASSTKVARKKGPKNAKYKDVVLLQLSVSARRNEPKKDPRVLARSFENGVILAIWEILTAVHTFPSEIGI